MTRAQSKDKAEILKDRPSKNKGFPHSVETQKHWLRTTGDLQGGVNSIASSGQCECKQQKCGYSLTCP